MAAAEGYVHFLFCDCFVTYRSEDKTLGDSFCMFVSSVCDSILLGFGSYKAHSFPTQRAFLSLGETVIKPVY